MYGTIHVKISVRTYFLSFGHTPSFSMEAVQSFLHEAPGDCQEDEEADCGSLW